MLNVASPFRISGQVLITIVVSSPVCDGLIISEFIRVRGKSECKRLIIGYFIVV